MQCLLLTEYMNMIQMIEVMILQNKKITYMENWTMGLWWNIHILCFIFAGEIRSIVGGSTILRTAIPSGSEVTLKKGININFFRRLSKPWF